MSTTIKNATCIVFQEEKLQQATYSMHINITIKYKHEALPGVLGNMAIYFRGPNV